MEKWSLSKLPPQGHEDVGRFFWDQCFKVSEAEKERLNLRVRWMENHRIWRGGSVHRSFRSKGHVTANLIFANIQRTVANLTAKNPSAEVVSLDGQYKLDPQSGQPIVDPQTGEQIPDDADRKVTVRMKDWWNTTEQINSLVDSALNMEIYGITVEKMILNTRNNDADTVVIDPFSYVIAPGNWETPNDAPYVGMARAMRPDEIEAMYGMEDMTINVDTVYSILGEERELNRPNIGKIGNISSTMYGAATMHPRANSSIGEDRSLLVELFVRDNTLIPAIDQKGKEIKNIDGSTQMVKKYPGGIRVVTIANGGNVVCSDVPNPNVNPELSREDQANTYLYDHFPYSTAASYRDPSSPWGFAAAEQVGAIAENISEILTRIYRYLARVMLPPLVLPQDTGLTEDDVNNSPGLILTPISSTSGAGIHYIQVPSLPADTSRLFDMLMGIFDRVYQIQDADRGDTPARVVAASAIVALQERNQVLMRHKIRMVDYLIRQRGRCAISFLQNFGVTTDPIKVDDQTGGIRGLDFIGRKFQYVVESGSTIAQTTLQVAEQSIDFFKIGAIDQTALLEANNYPNWRRIVERMAESGDQLDQAAQLFIKAGVPQETMAQLIQMAKQVQTGQPPTNGASQPQQGVTQ